MKCAQCFYASFHPLSSSKRFESSTQQDLHSSFSIAWIVCAMWTPSIYCNPSINRISLSSKPCAAPRPSYFRTNGGHRLITLIHFIGGTHCVSWWIHLCSQGSASLHYPPFPPTLRPPHLLLLNDGTTRRTLKMGRRVFRETAQLDPLIPLDERISRVPSFILAACSAGASHRLGDILFHHYILYCTIPLQSLCI